MEKASGSANPAESQGNLGELLEEAKGGREALIPLLQRIQERCGYVPPEYLEPVARHLGLFPSEVQAVVSFYSQFSLTPKGRHIVRVCRGTACHVRGGKSILRVAEENLGIKEGQTREDLRYSLETVACLGTCFLAPVMMVNRNYYGKLVPPQVLSILRQYE